MTSFFIRFLNDRRGATAIEYGLIAALIGMVVITGMNGLGDAISNKLYTKIVAGIGAGGS